MGVDVSGAASYTIQLVRVLDNGFAVELLSLFIVLHCHDRYHYH